MEEVEVRTSYPNNLCPHTQKRQFFAGYGTLGNIDVVTDDQSQDVEVTSQLVRKNDDRLIALKPTLPLLSPNEGR